VNERIVVAGGSGLIGRALTRELARSGAEVVVLSRAPGGGGELPAGARWASWDGRTAGGWWSECEGAAAVVNLAGENVASGRWTAARRRRLLASRIHTTDAVVSAISLARTKPRVLVQASAVGYYGARGDAGIDEDAAPGEGFLPELSQAWEAASEPVETHGVRRVLLRTGIVLARGGGALAKMLPIFRLGLGGPLGDGRQWLPWIHLADEVAAIRFLLDRQELAGPFNLAAPEPATNESFSRALARALGRPCFARVPAAALRLAVGEMAQVLLSGQKVRPRRLIEAGFAFRFPRLESALADLLD
jgi:uncharacterized protein (TIGR01777 family)